MESAKSDYIVAYVNFKNSYSAHSFRSIFVRAFRSLFERTFRSVFTKCKRISACTGMQSLAAASNKAPALRFQQVASSRVLPEFRATCHALNGFLIKNLILT